MADRTCMRCTGPYAIHYLGAGMWVCFTCWLRALGYNA